MIRTVIATRYITPFATPAAGRQAYADWLAARLAAAPLFVEEAQRARSRLV